MKNSVLNLKTIFIIQLMIMILAMTTNATNINLSGTISSDSTLNADTIFLTSSILVIDGSTLTIPAGTVVLGDSNCTIEIKGRLLVN